VDLIRGKNSQIATATEEHSSVVEGVNRSVVEVKSFADDINSSTEGLMQTFTGSRLSV
jgi:methyl-accepting chemotaxis protein